MGTQTYTLSVDHNSIAWRGMSSVGSEETDMCIQDKMSHFVILMTSCKTEEKNVVRIERLLASDLNKKDVIHVGSGPLQGIAVSKATQVLPEVGTPNIRMEFKAHMFDNVHQNNNMERRELLFWFQPQADRASMTNTARMYLKSLLEPEVFPKDYTGFIKKAILLTQSLHLIRLVELNLQPNLERNDDEYDVDDIEAKVMYKREKVRDRMAKHRIIRPRGKRMNRLDEEDELRQNLIANNITVLTPAKYDYQCLPEVSVSKKNYVSFKVQTLMEAHIALSSVYGDTSEGTYEIVLGHDKNSRSQIRDGGQGRVVEWTLTKGVLDSEELRPFWISWDDGTVKVGKGLRRGGECFLTWKVPEDRQHSVNCISVSTGSGSPGTWEFVEYINPEAQGPQRLSKRRQLIQKALLWHAKKMTMLRHLEDAFPKALSSAELLKLSRVDMTEMMTAYVHLKDLQKSGWIIEVSRGLWMRAPVSKHDKSHVLKLCKDNPDTRDLKANPPTIAIITALICEKYAIDVITDKKITYMKCRSDDNGEPFIYTVGKMGQHRVVTTKLSTTCNHYTNVINQEVAVTKLLEVFPKVEHIFLVGVGGAVPHYSDYRSHVRLGDIVVSTPHNPNGPVYMYCDKAHKKSGTYGFTHRSWWVSDDTIPSLLTHMKMLQERDSYSTAKTWERQIEASVDLLVSEPCSYARPSGKTDKLYAILEGETQPVLIEHPKPLGTRENKFYRENKPNIRYGPIASSKYIARNRKLRMDFAEGSQCIAYDAYSLPTMMVVERLKKESFVIIRGVSDYADGLCNLDWQPYAAVAAAAFAKHIIMAVPTAGKERGGYHPPSLPRHF